MDFFLLGNGFDLYHRLPTKYNNFLNTVSFLSDHYEESMNTVGKIFADGRLQECDAWIKLCYETHKVAFDVARIDSTIVDHLVDRAKNNLWFAYLSKSYNRDLGWIDFEKEVSKVIDAFSSFFKQYQFTKRIDADTALKKIHASHRYIVEQFPFFLWWNESAHALSFSGYQVNDEYIIEVPLHSGYFELNVDLIAKTLFASLMELGTMLREYLKCFVEEVATFVLPLDRIDHSPFFSSSSTYAITFNYTGIYEKLCKPQDRACHIHGSLDSQIVLGINPTVEDDKGSINTTFLWFKKYYQRVLGRTDDDYLHAIDHIRQWKGRGTNNHLTVFGHSLDQTDEDVIRECFDVSEQITVFYYEPDFHAAVRNLVAIFGKQEFDRLRREKSLTFKPQPTIDWEAYKNVQLRLPPL